jgi:hypothetical protein
MSPNRAPAVAMALWLAVQIGALALSAFRIPLAIGLPPAAEQSALAVMLVIQVSAAALLSPLLLATRRQTFIAIAVLWPMGELASFLADAPLPRAALGEAYVSAWLLTLSLWVWTINQTKSAALLPAVAAMLSIGGPILWYLRAEFVTQSDQLNWPCDAILGPAMGALSQVLPDRAAWSAWWIPAILIPPAILLGSIRRISRSKKQTVNPI